MPHLSVTYRDQWGLFHQANLGDLMQAQGFVGIISLPVRTHSLIEPGDWVVDLGANVGLITGQLCHMAGATGQVWAIEPIPQNVELLHYLKDANHLGQLHVFEGAVSNHTGREEIGLPSGGNSGHASFVKKRNIARAVEVQTWRLDDLVDASVTNDRISFIKLDVEGYEARVLEGASNTLRTMKPLILCEFNDLLLRDAGSSPKLLLELFESLGYHPMHTLPDLDNAVEDILLSAT